MKKYTQEEFDSFEIIHGYKQCPSGDYTSIKKLEKGAALASCAKLKTVKN